MINDKEIFIDTRTAAKRFNIKYDTLKKQRQLRIGLPYHKFGRLVRYNVLEVKEYLDQNRKGANTNE